MEPNSNPNYPKFYKKTYLNTIYLVKVREKEEKAKKLIKEHIEGEVGVAVSGKDSLVALSITASVAEEKPFKFAAVISSHFIDQKLPKNIIEELISIVKRFTDHVILHDEKWNAHANLFRLFATKYGFSTIVSGLRRVENGPHMAIERYNWGLLLNPIIHWNATEVWAYLNNYDIPVPRVYRDAMFPWTRLQDLAFR
jgi:3'-phosphoadenosine 5'-phosphosulfate sulfotransferase (PAPS reductase)/FAD synthetase